jgi:hypothetical protein
MLASPSALHIGQTHILYPDSLSDSGGSLEALARHGEPLQFDPVVVPERSVGATDRNPRSAAMTGAGVGA